MYKIIGHLNTFYQNQFGEMIEIKKEIKTKHKSIMNIVVLYFKIFYDWVSIEEEYDNE